MKNFVVNISILKLKGVESIFIVFDSKEEAVSFLEKNPELAKKT